MSAAAAALPPSVLREALLEGAGGDPAVRAVVGLLERAGLLSRADVVEACVCLGPDRDPVLWADLDVPVLQAAAWGDLPLGLSGAERRLLQVAVQVVDLGAALQGLGGQPLVWAVAAVLAMAGHGAPGCRAVLAPTRVGHDVLASGTLPTTRVGVTQ